MSLFALLYTADPLSPEQVIGILVPGATGAKYGSPALDATARKVDDPFVSEDLGLAAHTRVYFALDQDTLDEGHAKLAAAVRRFADATTGDLVFLYNDIAVLRRRSGQGEYRRASPDFAFPGWTAVDHIQLPRDAG